MAVQNSTAVAAIAGALTTIAIWGAKAAGYPDIPADVATAATTIIMAVLTHFVPDTGAGGLAPNPTPNP